MTPTAPECCTSVKVVPTERVTLDLDATALRMARISADLQDVSLSAWLSTAAREQAIVQAAKSSAEQDRLHPDEPPGWREAVEAHVFGEDLE